MPLNAVVLINSLAMRLQDGGIGYDFGKQLSEMANNAITLIAAAVIFALVVGLPILLLALYIRSRGQSNIATRNYDRRHKPKGK